jgi:hypothetical protein
LALKASRDSSGHKDFAACEGSAANRVQHRPSPAQRVRLALPGYRGSVEVPGHQARKGRLVPPGSKAFKENVVPPAPPVLKVSLSSSNR